jgi:SAM-dependent methyltransferase
MSLFSRTDERGYSQIFKPVGSTERRMERRHQWFLERARACNAKRILELGCGTGETAAYLAKRCDAEVLAIDISDEFLSDARQRHSEPRLEFRSFDILKCDLQGLGSFDLVIGNGILHHLVSELHLVLTNLHGMTRGKGHLAFIEPNYLNPYCRFIFGTDIGRRFAKLEPDEMAFRRDEIAYALNRSGWSEHQINTRDFLIPGLPKWVVRPVLAIEPIFESTTYLNWLAQSHFITAEARS